MRDVRNDVETMGGGGGGGGGLILNFGTFQVPHIAINACKFSTMEYVDIE